MFDESKQEPKKWVCAGNWKMNTLKKNVDDILEILKKMSVSDNVDVIVAPPAAYLQYVKQELPPKIQLSAQNCFKLTCGAYTGEISPAMLIDVGAEWVILGHSERRHIFGETNELIAEKVGHALREGLKVIGCVGETLQERERGLTGAVVQEQIGALSSGMSNWDNIVIAYEPVWAIGTGVVATPEQAQEVHALLRKWVSEHISPVAAKNVRIVYGGSVNAGNCLELVKQKDIDGFLIGGASLTKDFAEIAIACAQK